jgi:hypothetical protein
MFHRLQKLILRRNLKRDIKLAIKAIYSEQFDLDAVTGIIAASTEPASLLRAYVAIQIAAELSDPLTRADIGRAEDEYRSSAQHLHETDSEAILALRKESAELTLLKKTEGILERKLASKERPYSLESAIYELEKDRGPTSPKMREKYRKLAANVEQAEEKLQDHLDKKASEAAFDEWLAETKAKVRTEKSEED